MILQSKRHERPEYAPQFQAFIISTLSDQHLEKIVAVELVKYDKATKAIVGTPYWYVLPKPLTMEELKSWN